MKASLEVVALAVSDVDRSIAFYRDQAGFQLDVDYRPNDGFRVVQLTAPGSSCSLQFGIGVPGLPPGDAAALVLVVADLAEACRELIANGVAVEPFRHKPSADWQGDYAPGLDPGRRDYASFAGFRDPDGHRWTLQERGFHS
jgi:catechol 2,3-dioxygenase-like lactoylglutathione lyase family enzyme